MDFDDDNGVGPKMLLHLVPMKASSISKCCYTPPSISEQFQIPGSFKHTYKGLCFLLDNEAHTT